MKLMKIQNVTHSFGKRIILNDINLDISKGSIIAVSGRSGSGKTTLLSIVSGFLKPDSGKVYFNDKDIYKWFDFKRSGYRNRKIGYIFQSFNLLPDSNVYRNILFPSTFNLNINKVKDKINSLMDELGIADLKKQYPSTLSGGEKQRVAIARAVINNPDLVLADEPTGNLDMNTGKIIYNMFETIRKKHNISFVIVTHDAYIIKKSDMHYNLENGELVLK